MISHSQSRLRRRVIVTLRRSLFFIFGLIAIVLGVISVPSPLPIGVILILAGFGLLSRGGKRARRLIQRLRQRLGVPRIVRRR